MSIKTDYDFNGIEIPNATIRIDRLWGSSKEGWTALVGAYTEREISLPIVADEEGNESEPETVLELVKLNEFNHSCAYDETERGYVSMYSSLTEEFGGTEF